MKQRTIAAVLAGGLLTAAGLSAYLVPLAQADGPGNPGSSTRQSDDQRVVEYWTKNNFANMRNAKDLSVLRSTRQDVANPGRPRVGAQRVFGAQRVIRAAASSTTTSRPTTIGEKWTSGGRVAKTTGRVFFTIPTGEPGAGRYSCSGGVAPANNKAIVITAGHCVNDANEHWATDSSGRAIGDKKPGRYVKNWIFVPGYNGNAENPAPYGEFHATHLRANPHWIENANFNYDVGMATVGAEQGGPHQGALVANAVGTQGLGFNLPRHHYVENFGFPSASPYNGKVLDYSAGDALNADENGSAKGNSASKDDPNGSGDQVVRSNLTGGASGGPWFYNMNNSTGVGTQISVNSFSYTGLSAAMRNTYKIPKYNMWGPYFGSTIETMFDRAQGRSPQAIPQNVTTRRNTPVKVTLSGIKTPPPNSATPADPVPLTYGIKAKPAHGAVVRSGRIATYTPQKGFKGTDSFSYIVSNKISRSAPATVTVKVS